MTEVNDVALWLSRRFSGMFCLLLLLLLLQTRRRDVKCSVLEQDKELPEQSVVMKRSLQKATLRSM